VGDEPLLIHQATGAPVWVGRARADAALALLQAHPEVQIVLCDDGLQHLALARDIEICVMDARGTGNGWLLPAGPLREAWPRPVDAVLLTEALTGTMSKNKMGGQATTYPAPRQLADFAVRANGEQVLLSTLPTHSLHAVAGLARPESFFQMLRQAGLHLTSTTALPDHHDYQDWHNTAPGGTWLCTEKDAAKLWPHQADALAVPLCVSPDPAFWQALDARVETLLAGSAAGTSENPAPLGP
jgi:tetraacyldisaccharide 4'-kinase